MISAKSDPPSPPFAYILHDGGHGARDESIKTRRINLALDSRLAPRPGMIAAKLLFNQRHGLDSEMCTFSQSSALGLNMSYAALLRISLGYTCIP